MLYAPLTLFLFCVLDAAMLTLAVGGAAVLAAVVGPDWAPWVLAAIPLVFLPVLALAHWLSAPVWESLLAPRTTPAMRREDASAPVVCVRP